MSDHEHQDESGINRTWLSGIVVGAALIIAAAAGGLDAAPRSRAGTPAGPKGVVVLDDAQGTALYGAVVRRGHTVSIIVDGGETVVPRERVRWIESDTTELPGEYWDRFPRGKVKTAVRETRPAGPAKGCLITRSGAVLVGTLEQTADGARVTDPAGVETRVPRSAIRWQQAGAEGPTADYWRSFPSEPIDPAYQREGASLKVPSRPRLDPSSQALLDLAKTYPKVGEAYRTKGADWSRSTEAWFSAYADCPERLVFAQLKQAAEMYVHAAYAPLHIDVIVARVDRLAELAEREKLDSRGEVVELLATRIADAARKINAEGYPDTARQLARRMRSLGGVYTERSDSLLRDLSKPHGK